MKSARYIGNQTVILDTVDIPEVTEGMVKIHIKYCALCATDIHCIYNGMDKILDCWSFGHEFSGIIEEMGAGCEEYGFQIGDPVVVNPISPCGKCTSCKSGIPQYCQTPPQKLLHGFSEYEVVSINQIHKLPNNIDLRHAALVEPMSCAIRGIDLAEIHPGQNVAVSGIGGIGSLILNLVLLQGGTNVTAIDVVPSKLQNAKAIGAQHTINSKEENLIERAMEITDGKGFDVIFEVSGIPAAGEPCLKMLAQCGTIMYFAVYPVDYELPLNLFNLYMKEGKIKTAYTTPSIFPRAINLIPRMDMEHIIGTVFPLENIQDAIEAFRKSIYPKILIKCS